MSNNFFLPLAVRPDEGVRGQAIACFELYELRDHDAQDRSKQGLNRDYYATLVSSGGACHTPYPGGSKDGVAEHLYALDVAGQLALILFQAAHDWRKDSAHDGPR